jgi:flagellar motor switch protein FliN
MIFGVRAEGEDVHWSQDFRVPITFNKSLDFLHLASTAVADGRTPGKMRILIAEDILDLCAGSVVALDRQVQEPLDLPLDGKLIARGEVVVVDGNYGLRVREVLSAPTR